MKESFRPLLFQASILAVLAACSPQPVRSSSGSEIPGLEVTFRVSATVRHVEDVANPERSSGDLIFPNIPDYRRGEPQKRIVVPRSGFFEAGCYGRIVLTEKGVEVNTQGFMGSVSDDDKVRYFFPPDADDPHRFTIDYNRALKVDRAKYDSSLIKEGAVTIDGEVVKRRTFTEIDTIGAGLGEMTEAVKYPAGLHQVSCIFETLDGQTYQDTANAEIVDNRV